MRIGQSSNPALSEKRFDRIMQGPLATTSGETMTVQGTINKTSLMFLILLVTAAFTFNMAASAVTPWMIGGLIGGLIVALITIFKPEYSPYTAPIYAALEGLALGGISAFFESMYGGIVIQAVALTFGVFFVMLFIYKTGMIKVNAKFRRGIIAATGGVLLFYVLNWVFGMFGSGIELANMGLMGIGIQLVIVGIAALNLVLDFDFIEKSSAQGAPKFMEWFGAFGLMVTLVWLYLELLRLLALLSGRD